MLDYNCLVVTEQQDRGPSDFQICLTYKKRGWGEQLDLLTKEKRPKPGDSLGRPSLMPFNSLAPSYLEGLVRQQGAGLAGVA